MSTLETKNIEVRSDGGAYTISIGSDLTDELISSVKRTGEAHRVVVISDDMVAEKLGTEVLKRLASAGIQADLETFPHGEKNKTQDNATKLTHALLEKKCGRDTLLVALGGGVVGDVAGYVAATYMRGIPYLNMPTTLLSMVDASVGGKVGVDTPFGKNTIGAFWQPKAVLIDIEFLRALPKEQVLSGLIEATKVFYTADKSALSIVDSLDVSDPLAKPELLQDIIARAVEFKAGVAERDEREANERRILNFGHTVGHAIELLSQYSIPHGFAVGLGILVETKIAEDLGVLATNDRQYIVGHLARFGVEEAQLKEYNVDEVIDAMKRDKKAKAGSMYFVLLKGIGSVSTEDGQFAHAVEESVVKNAYQAVVNSA